MKNTELTELVTNALEDEAWRAWLPGTKSGAIGAVPFLAVILWKFGGEAPDKEKDARIVADWAQALAHATIRRGAVLGGHGPTRAVIPRDPVSLVQLRDLPPSWNWVLSVDDADSFLESMGMGFTCSGVLAHWYAEACPDALAPEVSALAAAEPQGKMVIPWTPERRAKLLADFKAAPGKTDIERRASLSGKWQAGDANLKKYIALAKKDAEASKPGSLWVGLQK